LVLDPYSLGYTSNGFELPLNHKVFLAAFDTIKKVADEGSCVIVGRCADYALADYSNVLNLFIKAPMEERIKRISKKYDLSDDKAKDMIIKKDKQRASYYNYYSTHKWADIKNYHMSIDSSLLGVDKTVDLIADLIERI
jgi:cytidylate kinase